MLGDHPLSSGAGGRYSADLGPIVRVQDHSVDAAVDAAGRCSVTKTGEVVEIGRRLLYWFRARATAGGPATIGSSFRIDDVTASRFEPVVARGATEQRTGMLGRVGDPLTPSPNLAVFQPVATLVMACRNPSHD